jgi:hypothetical protein
VTTETSSVRLKRIDTWDRSIHRERGVGVELTALSKSHGKVVCPHASTIASVLHLFFIRSYKALERAKRCVNTGGDDCANGYFPDAGNDGGYFGGGSTPGKRSLPQFNAKPLCLLFPMSSACRNE